MNMAGSVHSLILIVCVHSIIYVSAVSPVYRQLVNKESSMCIYDDSGTVSSIFSFNKFQATSCNITMDDQQWILMDQGTYFADEWFRLQNKKSECCIENIGRGQILHWPDGKNFTCSKCRNNTLNTTESVESQYWTTDYDDALYFRLRNMKTGKCMFQNDDRSPSRFGYAGCSYYDDQRWRWNIILTQPPSSTNINTLTSTNIPTVDPTLSTIVTNTNSIIFDDNENMITVNVVTIAIIIAVVVLILVVLIVIIGCLRCKNKQIVERVTKVNSVSTTSGYGEKKKYFVINESFRN